jgi:hypothetical protein
VLRMDDVIMKEIPLRSMAALSAIFRLPDLRKKVIVTKMYTCGAYHMLLHNAGQRKVILGLRVVTGKGGGGTDVGWISEGNTSISKSNAAGDPERYYPLYGLKCLKSGKGVPADPLRSSVTTKIPDEIIDFVPPWGALDDDGDEMWPVSSTSHKCVFHSDWVTFC